MGIGQLSLVEHCLCPLDPGRSLRRQLVHECEYHYSDHTRRRRTAHVRVTCALGLSAQDEFYLWGLLALTFSQRQPEIEFHATPHYCLRQLGIIDQHARRGGRQYRQFAAALERLSAVCYQNHAFYDPVRAEHRRVSFGLLSYSLPLAAQSSRAWRIVWDPLFFELILAVGGHLRFDLQTYRELDSASRRLFLLLSKVFRRQSKSPAFDLRQLGVQVLGFAPTVSTRDLKTKLSRCIKKLAERGIVSQGDPTVIFLRRANGSVSVRLSRGRYFRGPGRYRTTCGSIESPLLEPLRAIGVDASAISKLLGKYSVRLVQEWVDFTLAAKERFGPEFFKKSPAAFFMDNVRNAAAGTRSPPDWWQALRRAERDARERRRKARARESPATAAGVREGVALPETLMLAVQVQFEAAGQPKEIAQRNAKRFTDDYCQAPRSRQDDHISRLLQLFT